MADVKKIRAINKVYQDKGFVREDVLDLRISPKMRQELENTPSGLKFMRRYNVQEKYGVNIFNTKEEFETYYGKESYGRSTEDLERMWKQYKHRLDLIDLGRYEEWREQSYKDKYMNLAKAVGIDDSTYRKLNTLSGQQISDMVRGGVLPQLGSFNYNIEGVETSTEGTRTRDWIEEGTVNVNDPASGRWEMYREEYRKGQRYSKSVRTTKTGRKYIRGLSRAMSDFILKKDEEEQ